jgi:hypothetical protein
LLDENTVKLVDSLAWPLATIILVFILKKDIRAGIRNLSSIKHKDTEITFNSDMNALLKRQNEINISELDVHDSEFKVIAESSPRGAVIESWLNVEESINNFLLRYNNTFLNTRLPKLDSVAFELMKSKIGKGAAEMIQSLRNLRNKAVHLKDTDIDFEAAMQFNALAKRVIARIEEA